MQFRSLRFAFASALVPVALTLSATAVTAQESLADRLSVHGSINAGYGKSDRLGIFGIDKDGTSDYRAVALQFGYKISDKDRVVTQLLHRSLGTSPLQAIEKPLFPVWAFYEHKFDNGVRVKAGRNPLPRGLFNEVRFIGTLLPFYRVGPSVYGETLEYIDGVVVNKGADVGAWNLEGNVFAGGFDVKAVLPASTGTPNVVKLRAENSGGAQVWVRTPIKGIRVGAFANSYQGTPHATQPAATRGGRTLTTMYSAEGDFHYGFVRSEYTKFSGSKPTKTNYSAWYAQAGVKPTESFTLATEYNSITNVQNLPAPLPPISMPIAKDWVVGATWKPQAGLAFKLEGHHRSGYDYDVGVPLLKLPTAPPLVAKMAPATKNYYGIASIAVSF